MTFDDMLEEFPLVLKGVRKSGYEAPTKVQEKAIPVAFSGRDLIVTAKTGSGKTAAFFVPMLGDFSKRQSVRSGIGPRALVLCPTRELAAQIAETCKKLSSFIDDFRVVSLVGGVSMGPQRAKLKKRIDVLVATPGRLMDHMSEGGIDFNRIEYLVFDEADRMLDDGFIGDMRKISSQLPDDRKTYLFSATMPGEVLKFAKEFTSNAIELSEDKDETPPDIKETIYLCDSFFHKKEKLAEIVQNECGGQIFVFSATKDMAERLSRDLRKAGVSAAHIHGDLRQGGRDAVINGVRKGKISCLVATDIAARGLDVDNVARVVNFDIPTSPADYVHRIGRTARAGRSGFADTLIIARDMPKLRAIERRIGRKIDLVKLERKKSQSANALNPWASSSNVPKAEEEYDGFVNSEDDSFFEIGSSGSTNKRGMKKNKGADGKRTNAVFANSSSKKGANGAMCKKGLAQDNPKHGAPPKNKRFGRKH